MRTNPPRTFAPAASNPKRRINVIVWRESVQHKASDCAEPSFTVGLVPRLELVSEGSRTDDPPTVELSPWAEWLGEPNGPWTLLRLNSRLGQSGWGSRTGH